MNITEQASMYKYLIIIGLFLAVLIAALSQYLAPDDLGKCDDIPTVAKSCQKADAIVAISGGNTSARTQEAIELYQKGWGDVLIFSGAAKDTSGPSNAETMKQQAIDAGVPASDVLTEELSQTTKQNAERTKSVFESRDINRVVLVTSKYHQRRASLEFRARAGNGIVIVNHPTTHDDDWPQLWWLTPRGWWLTSGELVKIIAFYTGQSQ